MGAYVPRNQVGASGKNEPLIRGETTTHIPVSYTHLDTYKAIKSDNKAEKSAYGESAAWKAGGVAAGAAAGAAIGSIIPGLGTAVGALVGAGVGGIAGWIKGNKVKEEYQDNVEEMEKQAERAKRVYEVTGLSIDKVHFANDDLNEAMKDTNLTAEELANYINEDMAKVAQEAFGDITLSLTEIKDLAQEITFGKSIESVTEFSKATEDVYKRQGLRHGNIFWYKYQ